MSDRATIKAYFQTGDIPTQAQFEEWMDSIPFLEEDNVFSGTVRFTAFGAGVLTSDGSGNIISVAGSGVSESLAIAYAIALG